MSCWRFPKELGLPVVTIFVAYKYLRRVGIVCDVVSSIIYQLNADNSEAKFPLVFKSDKSRPKPRVPEPKSRLISNRGRLVRMVDQNGDKFERLAIKKK